MQDTLLTATTWVWPSPGAHKPAKMAEIQLCLGHSSTTGTGLLLPRYQPLGNFISTNKYC